MKKITLMFILLLFLLQPLQLFSQVPQKDVFVKTAQIIKIYSHAFGYKVLYRKSDLSLGEFYIPRSWFKDSAAKGELVWGSSSAYPYFSIFWIDGVFDHIRLYLMENINSFTWGVLAGGAEMAEYFDIEELTIEF